MRRAVTFALLLLPLTITIGSERPAAEERAMRRDGLLAYVPPQLRGFPGPAGQSGTVTAEVEVLPNGRVGAVRLDGSEWPFDEAAAVDAISRWRFVPFGGRTSRWRTVTIVVPPETGRDGDAEFEIGYDSPLTLRLLRYYPTVLRWPRVDGTVPEKRCQAHAELMHIELVPFVGEGVPPLPNESKPKTLLEFEQAFLSEFPNSGERLSNGCVIPRQKQAEIYICTACRKAKRAWLDAHPGFQAPY